MKLADIRPLATLALFASTPLFASDNPGAHQHGHAEVQIAISHDRVDLIFTSPAHNLLGFEHEARTEAQKQRLLNVQDWLSTTPLINTADASCLVKDATADIASMAEGDDHEENHQHHDAPPRQRHADVEVTQVLNCPGVGSATELTTDLPDRFPGIDQLDIDWIDSAGQASIRLPSGETRFSLAR
ncbi:ZrgA family zinc uptake protein [Marinobacter mobilis]|uniref:ZrgA family zinc uptake protein n=1 Tax=Marinobacter mobilis TaxID=488533 RepID=UPI0035C67A12